MYPIGYQEGYYLFSVEEVVVGVLGYRSVAYCGEFTRVKQNKELVMTWKGFSVDGDPAETVQGLTRLGVIYLLSQRPLNYVYQHVLNLIKPTGISQRLPPIARPYIKYSSVDYIIYKTLSLYSVLSSLRSLVRDYEEEEILRHAIRTGSLPVQKKIKDSELVRNIYIVFSLMNCHLPSLRLVYSGKERIVFHAKSN